MTHSYLLQIFSVGTNVWLAKWSDDPDSTQVPVRNLYLGVYGGLGKLSLLGLEKTFFNIKNIFNIFWLFWDQTTFLPNVSGAPENCPKTSTSKGKQKQVS